MSEKTNESFYIKEKNAEWLEQRPESKSGYVDDLLDAARKNELAGDNLVEQVEIRKLKAEIEGTRVELEHKEQVLSDAQEERSQRRSNEQSYTDELLALLERMEENNSHIWPENTQVDDLAVREKKQPTAVIEDAKELAAEKGMNIYNTQFVKAANAKYMEETLIGEVYNE